MKDRAKTKAQLISELEEIRERVMVLEEDKALGRERQESAGVRDLFEDFLKNANDLILSVAPDGKIMYANRAWRNSLGYKEEEVVGLSSADVVHPDSLTYYLDVFQRVMDGEHVTNVDAEMVTKNGEVIIVEGSARCQFDSEKPVAIWCILHDVTSRRRMEVALRESKQKYSILIEMSADGIMVVQDGVAVFANPSLYEMIGVEDSDILGKNMARELPERLIDAINSRRDVEGDVVDSGISISEGVIPAGTYEVSSSQSPGEAIWIGVDVRPIEYRGRTAEMVLLRDVTEYKQMEEQLRRYTEVLDALVEERTASIEQEKAYTDSIIRNIPDMLIIADRDRLITYANEPLAEFIGRDSGDVVGKSIIQLIEETGFLIPESMNALMDQWRGRLNAGEQIINLELGLNNSSGETITCACSASTIMGVGGETVGIMVLIRDISQQKELEWRITDHNRNLEDLVTQRTKELSESEAKYRAIIDHANDAIVVTKDLKFLYANEKVDMLGYTAEELLQLSPQDIMTEESLKTSLDRYYRRMAGEENISTYVVDAVHRDGSIVPVEMSNAVIEYEGQMVDLVVARDITERVHVEKELRQSEEKFRLIVNSANDGIVYVDAMGQIIDVNTKVGDLVGCDVSDLIGQSVFETELISREEVPRMLDLFRRASTSDSDQMVSLVETELTRLDGSVVPIETSTAPVVRGGRLEGFLSMLRDITERKMAQEELRASEQKYLNLVQQAADPIFIVQDNVFRFVNPMMAEFTRYPMEALLGMGFEKVLSPSSLQLVKERYAMRLSGEVVPNFYEVEIVDGDGNIVPAEVNAGMIEYEGRPADLVFLRDIRERKQAEEEIRNKNRELSAIEQELRELNLCLEQKVEQRTAEVQSLLRHKDEFITRLGHDLRSPLTPLVGLLPIVEKSEKDPKLKALVSQSVSNVNYMKELVGRTLTLARLNSPLSEIRVQDVNLSSHVSSVVAAKLSIFQDRNIEVDNRIDQTISVKADSVELRELLDNLATNSVQFSPHGGVLTFNAEQGEDLIIISVSDSGIGMTEEQLRHAFEEFYKADESRHELASSGLGLSICRRIVERHGGKIWSESQGVGKGTTVFFTLRHA